MTQVKNKNLISELERKLFRILSLETFRQDGVLMLRRSLLKCKNNDARTEAERISLNRSQLFEEQEA